MGSFSPDPCHSRRRRRSGTSPRPNPTRKRLEFRHGRRERRLQPQARPRGTAAASPHWCMGSLLPDTEPTSRRPRSAPGRAHLGDGNTPRRQAGGDRAPHVAVLSNRDPPVGTRPGPQLVRAPVPAGDERGRQVGQAVAGGGVDPADAEHGDAIAIVGARHRAAAAMDGAGAAHRGRGPRACAGRCCGRHACGTAACRGWQGRGRDSPPGCGRRSAGPKRGWGCRGVWSPAGMARVGRPAG
jgi:hypothetical protein